jgi:hypothetical protein
MSRISSQIIFGDLTGGINNVDNKETINASTKKTQTPDMVNVEYFKLGGIKTMEGNVLIGDKQDHKIVGGWEYTKGNRRYMIIGLSNGDVKIYNPASEEFDLIYSFATPTDRMSFCNMNNGVVVTNGIDEPIFYEYGRRQVLSGSVSTTTGSTTVTGNQTEFTVELNPGDKIEIDGATYFIDSITDDTTLILTTEAESTLSDEVLYLSTISSCNATLINEEDPNVQTPIRGLAIQYYNGRLWIGGDNGLFYSQVGQYNKWDIKYDAGVLYSIYNDTSEIKALGLFSEFLVVHKKFSTYILTCTGDSSTINVKPFSNITCESQQSWIVSNTKYYVYSREFMDIYPLVQHTIFSDKFLGEPVTQKVRNIFQNLIAENSGNIFCVGRPKARQMIFYLPLVNQLGSAYGLIFDHQTKSWLLRNVPQNVTIAFNYNSNVYIGTEDGLVLREFASRTFKVYNPDTDEIEDAPIISYYKSPWFDWTNGYTQSFAEFIIELDNSSENKFYIRTQKDGQSRFEDRIIDSLALNGEALIWDGPITQELPDNDTSWDNDIWVKGTFENIRMLLPNNVFEDFQLEIGTNELGQAFSIYQYGFRRIETDEAPW